MRLVIVAAGGGFFVCTNAAIDQGNKGVVYMRVVCSVMFFGCCAAMLASRIVADAANQLHRRKQGKTEFFRRRNQKSRSK